MQYPGWHTDRDSAFGSFVLTLNGTSAPTIKRDKGKVIASVARNGAGDYTVTLTREYAHISAIANNLNSSNAFSKVAAVVSGGGVANTIDIENYTESAGAHALADETSVDVVVMYELSRSGTPL
ncbi:MAG TPA: hypothetical protein ENK57_17185 [Polyangiaceae bacterium]|nr:hypothetical protein [Polyangiaceae bacterium]